jgi:pyruvate carboxylase subunit B
MISNLVSQLRELGAADKLKEVLAEIPKVREDTGYPPLVTPTSQIVGSQAVLNVVYGERYKQVSKETKAVVLGQYGETPAPIKEDVLKKVGAGEKPITGRPADLLQPELEKAKGEIGALAKSDEDVLSYVLFPPVAKEFFEWRDGGSGLEKEVVAAIAAALAQEQRQAALVTPRDGHGHAHSAWKMAARQRGLRR